MLIHLQFLSITYVRQLKHPMMDIGKRAVEIIDAYYDLISPRFPLSLSNLQSFAGNTMAEVGVRIMVFGENGVLEFLPDRFEARFSNLRTDGDTAIAKECVGLAEQGLDGAYPNGQWLNSSIKTKAWFKCEGGSDSVTELIDSSVGAKFHELPKSTGAGSPTFTIGADIQYENEGWSMGVSLAKSALPNSDLYLAVDLNYLDAGTIRDLPSRIEHFEATYKSLLAHFGLELPEKIGSESKEP